MVLSQFNGQAALYAFTVTISSFLRTRLDARGRRAGSLARRGTGSFKAGWKIACFHRSTRRAAAGSARNRAVRTALPVRHSDHDGLFPVTTTSTGAPILIRVLRFSRRGRKLVSSISDPSQRVSSLPVMTGCIASACTSKVEAEQVAFWSVDAAETSLDGVTDKGDAAWRRFNGSWRLNHCLERIVSQVATLVRRYSGVHYVAEQGLLRRSSDDAAIASRTGRSQSGS